MGSFHDSFRENSEGSGSVEQTLGCFPHYSDVLPTCQIRLGKHNHGCVFTTNQYTALYIATLWVFQLASEHRSYRLSFWDAPSRSCDQHHLGEHIQPDCSGSAPTLSGIPNSETPLTPGNAHHYQAPEQSELPSLQYPYRGPKTHIHDLRHGLPPRNE